MAKYKVPVVMQAMASKVVDYIECDSYEEYKEKFDKLDVDKYDTIRENVSNDFNVHDSEIDESIVKDLDDMKYYKEEK